MSLLWKLGGIALLCGAAYLLLTMYGKAQYHTGQLEERSLWQTEQTKAEHGKLVAFQAGLAQRDKADTIYHETIRTLPPVTNTIIERATAYAATPDGSLLCLPADRVRGIDQSRSILFPGYPAPAPGGQGTVPAGGPHPQP